MLRNYLRVSDLTPADLVAVLDLAAELDEFPHALHDLLDEEVVALYFATRSTRTRVSFAVAIRRLGGIPEALGVDDLQLGRGESIEDTARVLSAYLHAFVVRTVAHADVERFAGAASMPVINALTDTHDPCQALADLLTLRRRHRALRGVRLAYVGDGNNITHSIIEAGALAGMHVVVATPPGFEPDPLVVADARELAATTDASITLTHDPHAAVAGADAVYTDVWLSLNHSAAERETRVTALTPYRVDAALMAEAAPHAVFMHCLPACRGQEVTSEVIDGPRSVVFDQAANRLCTEQAVLAALLMGRLAGRIHSREVVG